MLAELISLIRHGKDRKKRGLSLISR